MNFSIVIPTYHRSRSLYKTLLSLARTSFRKDQIEVVVVDNGSAKEEIDATKAVVEAASRWFTTRYFYSPCLGPSSSRNVGIRKSKYQHIIFIDDDVIVPKHFIQRYEFSWLKNRDAAMIGGKIVPKFVRKQVACNPEFDWVYAHLDLGSQMFELKHEEVLLSANMSVKLSRKEREFGIFNEVLGKRYFPHYCLFGEDTELCLRFQLEGKKVMYDPLICVMNTIGADRMNASYYWKRIINGGAESHLLTYELRKTQASFKGGLGWPQVNRHSSWEHVAFFLGYIFFGTFIINVLKLQACLHRRHG